jgi:putative glutathione S-transferase
MGLLVKGTWHTDWYDTSATGGEFVRQDAQFRHTITPDGSGDTFKAEPGRYHLYVSLACPWAHRTLIMRKLKKLELLVGVTVVKPEMLEHGWELSDVADPSPIPGIRYMHEVYTAAQPQYSGRVTVPVLWDTRTGTIVNNESSEIIRILNSGFNDFTEVKTDYYPLQLRAQIDTVNDIVYHNINNGVYKCGFATTQQAYDKAFANLFKALDELEQRLDQQRYLLGAQITEADWRLFTTLIRFDSVYFGHFKCNRQQIEQFPNLSNYLRDLYQQPGIAETVNFAHIKTHYYYSHETINPTRIVPLGPQIDYSTQHDREQLNHRQTGP